MGMMGDMLQRMDKNSDGVLSKEEYLGSYEERFAQMDENKDGKVTKEESEAYGKRLREQFGSGGRPGGDGGPGNSRRPGGEGGTRPEGDRPKRPEGEAPPAPKQ